MKLFDLYDLKTAKPISREEVWLLSAVIKWTGLAIITGVLVGCAASAFINAVNFACRFVGSLGKYKLLLLFPGFFLSYMLVRVYTRDAKVEVVEAIHHDSGAVDLRAVPARVLATIITMACGGASGKEAPSAMVGAGLMYAFSKIFHLDERDCKKLVIIGSAAGISAVFGTPIAGAIFGIEILYMGEMLYDVLMASLTAGVISSMLAAKFHAGGLHALHVAVPNIAPSLILWSVVCGVFFGIVAKTHIETLNFFRRRFRSMNVPHKLKPLLGAAAVFVIALIFGDGYMGIHEEYVSAAIHGNYVPWFAFIIKSLALALTLGCGGAGGVLMPTMFVGATAGALFANILGLSQEVTASIGFVAVLAAATNTPIASTILAMELFGSSIAPFAAISCCAAYVVAGHRTLYEGQRFMRPKTDLFVRRVDEQGREQIVERFETVPYSKLLKFKLHEAKKNLMPKKKERPEDKNER